MIYKLQFFIIFILSFVSCFKIEKKDNISIKWESINNQYPPGISVFKGINQDLPLRAWYAKINLNSDKISAKILSSKDKDINESPLKMMVENDSEVLINGGYFIISDSPTRHVGLLKTKGILNEPASKSVIKDSIRYFINRGAFGIKNNGSVDIAWCSTRNDSIYEWDLPLLNRPGYPDAIFDFKKAKHWDVYEAFHAGPVLIWNNKVYVTTEEEVFFNTPVSGVQPRSAVGYTKDQELILIVVDGRQAISRGVYLEELAIIMHDLGCVEALNLDGGGSSALLVKNELMNRPSGRSSMRKIMSAISINYNKEL